MHAAKKSSQSTMAVDAIFPATLATEKNNDKDTHCNYYDNIIVVVIHYAGISLTSVQLSS